jgi:hypothetical protein
MKTVIRFALPYLVFPSSFFSMPFSIGASFAGSPAFCSPPAGAAASGAGAGAGAGSTGAGGGGGGGSSFLPHPAKVRVEAKSAITDNEIIFLPILRFTSFPVTRLANLCWLGFLYRTCFLDFQGHRQNYPSQPHHKLRLGSRQILCPRQFLDNHGSEIGSAHGQKLIAIFSLTESPNGFFIASDNSSAQSRIASPQIADTENNLHARALFQDKPRSITRPVKAEKSFSARQNFEKNPKRIVFKQKISTPAPRPENPVVF